MDLVQAASAAIGLDLAEPAPLGGSGRSAVLRCRRPDGGTVVVKGYPATSQGASGFSAEAAGLRLTADLAVGPRLLAADPVARLIVMSDLGSAPSLADLLLGETAKVAEAALLDWTRSLARLAVATAGRQSELEPADARQAEGADGASDGIARWLSRHLAQVPDLLRGLGIGVPPGLPSDLAAIKAALAPGRHEVFSPGDICPDNNLITDGGVRFIDFEAADFHPAFLDAAYLRMPFSSCWCVFRLPGRLASAAEAQYRGIVAGVHPALADDLAWEHGVRMATAAWTLHAMTYLLDRSLVADGQMIADGRTAPTARQLLRYRWHRLRAELSRAGELPALTALVTDLLTRTGHWQVPDLPLYPALSDPTPR